MATPTPGAGRGTPVNSTSKPTPAPQGQSASNLRKMWEQQGQSTISQAPVRRDSVQPQLAKPAPTPSVAPSVSPASSSTSASARRASTQAQQVVLPTPAANAISTASAPAHSTSNSQVNQQLIAAGTHVGLTSSSVPATQSQPTVPAPKSKNEAPPLPTTPSSTRRDSVQPQARTVSHTTPQSSPPSVPPSTPNVAPLSSPPSTPAPAATSRLPNLFSKKVTPEQQLLEGFEKAGVKFPTLFPKSRFVKEVGTILIEKVAPMIKEAKENGRDLSLVRERLVKIAQHAINLSIDFVLLNQELHVGEADLQNGAQQASRWIASTSAAQNPLLLQMKTIAERLWTEQSGSTEGQWKKYLATKFIKQVDAAFQDANPEAMRPCLLAYTQTRIYELMPASSFARSSIPTPKREPREEKVAASELGQIQLDENTQALQERLRKAGVVLGADDIDTVYSMIQAGMLTSATLDEAVESLHSSFPHSDKAHIKQILEAYLPEA